MFRRWLDKRAVRLARGNRGRAGRLGEIRAARLLRGKGFRILQRNWRYGRGEIDLIARDGEILVFVEVRTRRAEALVNGHESIRPCKQAALLKTAKAYLRQLRRPVKTYRYDVVSVAYDEQGFKLQHLENLPLFR